MSVSLTIFRIIIRYNRFKWAEGRATMLREMYLSRLG